MITKIATLPCVLILLAAISLTSCYTEDPGPLQETERQYTVTDFDRLEIGDAMHIHVQQGNFFEITARGDRRNINDLEVYKEGSTLMVRFDNDRNRHHDTYIDITMPDVLSVNFSSASDSKVSGFYDLETLNVYVSGASVCQLNVDAASIHSVVSGASQLNLRGSGEVLNAELTGASMLQAFSYPVNHVTINASGASDGRVMVSDQLDVIASDASIIIYRGEPSVTSEVSGSSTVRQD